MNYNETNQSLLDTRLLQLQTLDKEINVNLYKYKQSINDYLQNISLSKTTKKLISFPDTEFWGSSSIENGFVVNGNECLNMCLNNVLCTGATYDKNKKYCWARSGEGQLIENKNTISYISSTQQEIKNMKTLNNKIQNLQKQKIDLINSLNKSIPKENMHLQEYEMNKMIEKLKIENEKLDSLIKHTNLNNEEYEDTTLIVKKNNMVYNILVILVILVIVVLGFVILQRRK
jgi:hypothetical protein